MQKQWLDCRGNQVFREHCRVRAVLNSVSTSGCVWIRDKKAHRGAIYFTHAERGVLGKDSAPAQGEVQYSRQKR